MRTSPTRSRTPPVALVWTLGVATVAGMAFDPEGCWAQATPEEAVRAFFEAGSGPAGTQPLDRLIGLFPAEGRLITVRVSDTGPAQPAVHSPEGYVASARAYLATTTQYEIPTRMWVEEYGNIGHVFCAFEARRTPAGEAFYRGVASSSCCGTVPAGGS